MKKIPLKTPWSALPDTHKAVLRLFAKGVCIYDIWQTLHVERETAKDIVKQALVRLGHRRAWCTNFQHPNFIAEIAQYVKTYDTRP